MSDAAVDEELRATERWFVGRGLPHFIADYSASRDVLTRALPVLVFVFLVQVVNGINLEDRWPWWANALAVLGSFGIFLGVWAAVNRARGRPAFARPAEVGGVELVVFVVVPAIPPLVFGLHPGEAFSVVVGNLVLLGVVYVIASYAVGALVGWALQQLWRQLGDVIGLVIRALPLLLLVITFMFLNAEIWAVASDLDGAFFWFTLALFAGVGALFALLRLPREIGALARFDSWEVVLGRVQGTPGDALVGDLDGPTPTTPRLSRREWGNVGLSLLFTEAIQVMLVVAMVFAFFFVFGLLTVTPSIQSVWTALPIEDLEVIDRFDIAGREVVLTWELVKTSTFLATFSGLYFTVYLLTDATYREEFLTELLEEFRVAFAVRAVYLALRPAEREPGAAAGRRSGSV